MIRAFMRKIREKRFSYEPLVRVELDGEQLIKNFQIFDTMRPGVRVAPVLKSNAYGHGLLLIGKKLDKEKPPFLVVDSYHEAIMLKNERVRSDILVLGYTFPQNILCAQRDDVIFGITTIDQIEELTKSLKRKKRFHLKIDTGMHRQGILESDISRAVQLIKKNPFVVLDGICSHFADADTKDSEITKEQIERWNAIVELMKKEFPDLKYIHTEATAGTQYGKLIHANVLRVGLGIYGIDSAKRKDLPIQPILRMESVIAGIKKIKEGDYVGYNATFSADREMTIAVVPVGYFEGVDRRLSNKGFFKMKGEYCAVVGRVSMNMTSINISSIKGAKEGDLIEVISSNSSDKNSVESMAEACGAISYEILVGIPEKIRRVWK
ncbi:MAG: alanine racemase [Patescibacteria group bacterium]